jgi:hypothetical protein
MKSVPSIISYLHEFSQIFPHLVSIFLVWKCDFRGFLKLENFCRVGPVSQLRCRHLRAPIG